MHLPCIGVITEFAAATILDNQMAIVHQNHE